MINHYIAILTPKKEANSIQQYMESLNETESKILQDHFHYMEELDKMGKILLGGPCLDAKRLVIILQGQSLQEINEFMVKDPTVLKKLTTLEIHPFSISVGHLQKYIG